MTAPAAPVHIPLDSWGLIHVGGSDAIAFLHAQLSNDLAALGPDASQWTAYLSPKGRMLAGFLAWRDGGEGVYLCADRRTVPMLVKRLSMFVLRAKARVTDASAGHRIFGSLGETGPPPHRVLHGETVRIGLPPVDGVARVLLVTLAGASDAANVADASAWERAMIRAGEPWIGPQTQDAFVPQMVNFDALGGISFRKGCYPGQEVVARAHYRGAVKRRMVRASVGAPATPGMGLFGADGQESGTVVNACADGAGGSELLAVIPLAEFGSNRMRLGAPDGPCLIESPLPYEIPAEA
ncbi:MAG: folate-binding protein YgfZ [Burkholderiales bacterium]|nr:folate-binding protein YgfZ [Burkholderiales bacterium]